MSLKPLIPMALPQGFLRISDRWLRQGLIRAIALYQKYLSPYKKFSCAYRVLHRSHSCSQGVKIILRDVPLREGIPRIHRQFRQCRQASIRLRELRATCDRSHSRPALATPNSILFPTLSDRIFPVRRGDTDGYEESRRERKRERTGGIGERPSTPMLCNCYYCCDCGPAEGCEVITNLGCL